jgi:aminoglycoside phosphotransferase (APT) family kinase protein
VETTAERARRAAAALRAHAPDDAGTAVVGLGHGLDNTTFLAGDLVLRVANGGDVTREARLLRFLAPRLPVPVPNPRFVDERAGVLAYPLVPGRPLLGRRPPPGAAAHLGRFLRALHDIDLAEVDDLLVTDPADPQEWLDDLQGPDHLVAVVRASVPPPTHRLTVAHADLGSEHLLEAEGELTGVIDWSDAAVTDPALDLARPYRDFGPTFLRGVLRTYGGLTDPATTWARITFHARCAALEDLAYGQDTGRGEYARAAEHAIDWLFPAGSTPPADRSPG